MSLKKAVDDRLAKIDAKIQYHKEQIELLKENKKYWENLLKDVEKLVPQNG